jgi:hypothetical protein
VIRMPANAPLAAARQDPPSGVSPDEAAAAVEDVLGSIGDMCPECPPDDAGRRCWPSGAAQARLAVRTPGRLAPRLLP